ISSLSSEVPVYRAPDLWRFIAYEELSMLLDPVRGPVCLCRYDGCGRPPALSEKVHLPERPDFPSTQCRAGAGPAWWKTHNGRFFTSCSPSGPFLDRSRQSDTVRTSNSTV